MKVIGTDLWARDYNGGRDETVMGENLTQEEAETLAASLNDGRCAYSNTYYAVRPDDYQPYVFKGY